MNKKKIWSKEETALFRQIYNLYTYDELAEIFNCSRNKISNKATTEKLAPKKQEVIIPEGMKKCSACQEILSLDDFGNNRSTSDGKATECKSCASLSKSLAYRNKKFLKEKEEDEKLRTAYIKSLENKKLVCKHHGELTLDDYRIYKGSNGRFNRKCKKCEYESLLARRAKRLKEKGYE